MVELTDGAAVDVYLHRTKFREIEFAVRREFGSRFRRVLLAEALG